MLRQLRLQIELEQRKKELLNYLNQKKGFEARKSDIEKRFAEAGENADLSAIEADLSALEKDVSDANLDKKIAEAESEIERISSEMQNIGKNAGTENGGENKNEEKRGRSMNKYQARKLFESGEYYERSEVKEFYERFKNLRAVGGEGLTIPEVIVNRIFDIMGDYTTIYPLVDKIRVNGTTRILLDTDTTAATWIEQKSAIPVGDVGTITNVDFDGFKVGKVVFVDNHILQDSIINLDDYVTKKIARAIALALDDAILNGKGDAQKQPLGIIEALSADHKVTVNNPGSYADIVRPIHLIDTGKDSVGEIVAVMNRKTFYNRLLDYTVATTAGGEVVGKLPNIKNPDLLGLRVVFNNNMADDKILFGDFGKYTLVERETVTIDPSEHVKFVEDQMAFRGKARYDGKPTDPDAFVLVTLTYST